MYIYMLSITNTSMHSCIEKKKKSSYIYDMIYPFGLWLCITIYLFALMRTTLLTSIRVRA
jgi:hypothetical protein